MTQLGLNPDRCNKRVMITHCLLQLRWHISSEVGLCGQSVAVRLCIFGRVQGVGYRAWLTRIAEDSGVDGWTRNRTDGSVEALLHGDPATVRAVVERCQQGPRLARVERIEQSPDGSIPDEGFVQRPTT